MQKILSTVGATHASKQLSDQDSTRQESLGTNRAVRFSNAPLRQIKKTQPRHIKILEQPLLRILPLQLRQLLRRHLTPVRRQRPVHFAPDGEQRLFVRIRS